MASLACGFGSSAPQSAMATATGVPVSAPVEPVSTSEALPAAPTSTPSALILTPIAVETVVPTAFAAAPPPAILESRRLTLEYPPQIRVGDSDVIRLTLEVDTLGNITPTAYIEGNVISGNIVQIPNLFDTHNVIAEARLDLAGVQIRPDAQVDEPLLPGQSVTFFWSVQPVDSGTFRGTAWLALIFVDKASGAVSRKAISAQPVEIEGTKFLGAGGVFARTFGGIGTAVGAVLGFPFVTDILKWLWAHFVRKAA